MRDEASNRDAEDNLSIAIVGEQGNDTAIATSKTSVLISKISPQKKKK